MKTSIDHLPEDKQTQLRAIAELFKTSLPVDKLILFGSYARGEQVEDLETGYLSDFDLCVVVDTAQQADDVALWAELEMKARAIAGRIPVTLIVHDIRFINHEIRRGQFFFLRPVPSKWHQPGRGPKTRKGGQRYVSENLSAVQV